jgi:hypothetical protein
MEDQQLSTLFDYTKFHIGLYATLISGLFGVIAYANEHRTHVLKHLLRFAKPISGLILVAGAAGGAIASNIAEYKDFNSFSSASLSLFGVRCRLFNYHFLAHLEHAAFWFAVLLGAYAFLSIKSPSEIQPREQDARGKN